MSSTADAAPPPPPPPETMSPPVPDKNEDHSTPADVAPEPKPEEPKPEPKPDPLLQYLVVRKDLDWPLGAVVAQGAHAAVAAVAEALASQDLHTQQYVSPENLPHMSKSVLGVEDIETLKKLAEKLRTKDVKFYLWVEQPENLPVALATWPRPRSVIGKAFRGLKLLG